MSETPAPTKPTSSVLWRLAFAAVMLAALVTLRAGGTSREARVVLQGEGDGARVAAVSFERECECPDPDFDKPCHLR